MPHTDVTPTTQGYPEIRQRAAQKPDRGGRSPAMASDGPAHVTPRGACRKLRVVGQDDTPTGHRTLRPNPGQNPAQVAFFLPNMDRVFASHGNP
jgi:hypothetical protein